jgi:hypothetical protein
VPTDSKRVRKSIELDRDLDKWFDEKYDGVSLWWFINSLMRAFKDLHTEEEGNKLNPVLKEAAGKVEI